MRPSSPRGILIIDLQDGVEGQTAGLLRERTTLVESAERVAAALGLLQEAEKPELLCATPGEQSGTDDKAPQANTPYAEPERMVARDPAMAALMRRVEDVAASNTTVLITGESGTGKELIAAHLHRSSRRSNAAFVVLNCAAVPESLLESELFGHEKGAFFGATSRRIGKFEAANGGTLFLDEIGELDLRIQAKVLRALEQREIDRLGGDRPVRIDARIIATTNRDLQSDVRQGRFRADLLFRLNVITLKVPPLRERPADLPVLADFFVEKFAGANGRTVSSISPAALALLQRHPWPGNVREMENVIHRAVLTETGAAIMPSALDIGTFGAAIVSHEAEVQDSAEIRPATPTAGRTIDAVEKDMILDTLCQCKGNRSQTAAVLGISIRTLRNKLHEYERSGTRIPRPVVVAIA
jgi:DNA-binding NtrC family response regulator